MSKELEALKRLLPYLPEGDMLEDEVRILSIALERKEKLEKVVKIIKNKNIHLQDFNLCKNEKIYNCGKFTREYLTKNEFNLLKEMLENAKK